MAESQYERRDAIGLGVKGSLLVGGVGAILSGVQNSLAKQNVGAFGILTRTGSTVVMFGMHTHTHTCRPRGKC